MAVVVLLTEPRAEAAPHSGLDVALNLYCVISMCYSASRSGRKLYSVADRFLPERCGSIKLKVETVNNKTGKLGQSL